MSQTVTFVDEDPSSLKTQFSNYKWKRLFLVTGKKSFSKSGAEEFVDNYLLTHSTAVYKFSDFQNNPNIFDLKRGLNIVREFNPSAIIAIGGGSVIDMGKLIRHFLTFDGDILSHTHVPNGKKIPLIAIPTTAGTGSEATHFAVVYDEDKLKHSIAHSKILPDFAVINPVLTYNQSSYLTACAGFDALAQGIEAYWNKNATNESDIYAIKAINLIFDSLKKIITESSPELRKKMAVGAYWAGRAINITKTTAPHAFSYPFTSHYGIPHGHAVALTFPSIAQYNLTYGDIPLEKVDIINNLFDIRHDAEASIHDYISSIGLNLPQRDYDMDLLIKGINPERLANNPANISKEDAIILINRILTNIH